MAVTTLTFSDCFEDYTAFKEYTDEIALYDQEDATAEAFNKHLFYTLYNRYVGVAIAYETTDLFLAEFGLAYQQYFKLFLEKKNLVDEIYKLSIDDMAILSESINNFSNNPNYLNKDAWELLTYTSNQTRSRAKSGKLIAYLTALRQLPDMQIEAMIKAFDYLWLDLLPTQNLYFFENYEEDYEE